MVPDRVMRQSTVDPVERRANAADCQIYLTIPDVLRMRRSGRGGGR